MTNSYTQDHFCRTQVMPATYVYYNYLAPPYFPDLSMKPPASILVLLLGASLSPNVSGQRLDPNLKRVTINDGIVLHYIEKGEGEPVIFVHGFASEYGFWLRQVEAFANNGYRAITYSRRHSFPNKNPINYDHSASHEAKELASFMRKLKLRKAHVIGHSYGAHTALMLALQDPELLHSVTLAEAPIGAWLSSLPEDRAEAGRTRLNRLLRQGIEPAKAALKAGNNELAMQTMIDAIGKKGGFQKLPGFVRASMIRNVNELKALVASKNRYPEVDRNQVRRLTVPTLILAGANSDATSKLTDPELLKLLPKGTRKHVVIPNAGHVMWVDQPVMSRNAVLAFIRGT